LPDILELYRSAEALRHPKPALGLPFGDKVKGDGQECPSYTVKGGCPLLGAAASKRARVPSASLRTGPLHTVWWCS